jgi:hypothetical protein
MVVASAYNRTPRLYAPLTNRGGGATGFGRRLGC